MNATVNSEPSGSREDVFITTPLVNNNETTIVRVVDEIPFTLTAETTEAAEDARITLTDLARVLGYEDKSKLKQLAERHASELAEFGVTATVAVTQKIGIATRTWEEPTFNPDQCILLGLASQTEVGRKLRVRMLKAYKALIESFENRLSYEQLKDKLTELFIENGDLRDELEHERMLACKPAGNAGEMMPYYPTPPKTKKATSTVTRRVDVYGGDELRHLLYAIAEWLPGPRRKEEQRRYEAIETLKRELPKFGLNDWCGYNAGLPKDLTKDDMFVVYLCANSKRKAIALRCASAIFNRLTDGMLNKRHLTFEALLQLLAKSEDVRARPAVRELVTALAATPTLPAP